MGERELILDGMSVEDVMRILGAASAGAKDTGTPSRRSLEPREASATTPARADEAPADSSDWRAILRAAGNEPSRATTISRPDAPPASAASAASAAPAAPTPPAPPTQPSSPPPAPDELDDADAPEDAAAGPPAYVMRPTPQATTRVRPTPSPAGEPPSGIVVGTSSRELFGGPLSGVTTLEQLAELIANCTKCPLYKTATKPVPGQGSPTAELVCVGEAPGENEDKSGLAFVGQAGQLLTKILAAINLQREDVFICNVLKHRPPGNRNPMPQEVEACSPYLVRQLEVIRPKVIVAFGTFAAQTLLETKLSIGKLRGSVHKYYGIPLIVTYHPAALLRNPAWKRPTWEDVQLARRILDRAPGA
jgi:uracil-DNA glycosylase